MTNPSALVFECPGCDVFGFTTADELAGHMASHNGPAPVSQPEPTTSGRFETMPNGFGGTTTRRRGSMNARRQPHHPQATKPEVKPEAPGLDRIRKAAERLAIDTVRAAPIAHRVLPACEALVVELESAWEATTADCCKGQTIGANGEPEWKQACEHLRRLWDARSYRDLAKAGAPIEGAWPCSCNGSGKFYSGGAVVNGQYTGRIGECFRCSGKGWQSQADRKRNHHYDTHVRRIPGV